MALTHYSGLDTGRYTGDMNYIDIPSSNLEFWRIAVQGVTVGGNDVQVVCFALTTSFVCHAPIKQ